MSDLRCSGEAHGSESRGRVGEEGRPRQLPQVCILPIPLATRERVAPRAPARDVIPALLLMRNTI